MKKILTIVCFCICLAVLLSVSGCLYCKMLIYKSPDIDDMRIFQNRKIPSSHKPVHFKYSNEFSSYLDTVRVYNPSLERNIPLDSILILDKTKAFIIYLDNRIIYERYFDGMKANDVSCVFSMSKSVLSALTGILIDKGYIKSVDQKISDYIPGLLNNNNFNNITIRQLLQMSSGLEWKRNVTFDDDGRLYYSSDIRKQILSHKLAGVPGDRWEYKNIDAELLGWVIENATNAHISDLVHQYLWDPMGAENDAWWSLDKKNGNEKASSSLNASAKDILKFGCIYLNNGYFNGNHILSEGWIQNIFDFPPSAGQQADLKHNFLWWIPNNGADREIVADGYLGQRLSVNPKYNIVIVKFGDANSNTNIDKVLMHIIETKGKKQSESSH
jgi:CubicO group peptidase (beta-lactamase class C family)